jgi:hypothetical protein
VHCCQHLAPELSIEELNQSSLELADAKRLIVRTQYIIWTNIVTLLRNVLIISTVFLQSGISYYISAQILALAILFWLAFKNKVKVDSFQMALVVGTLFSINFIFSAVANPDMVLSSGVFLPHRALLNDVFAFLFLIFSGISFCHIAQVRCMSAAAKAVILLLLLFAIVGEVWESSLFGRWSMYQQNVGLITNYMSSEQIQNFRDYAIATGILPRIDLTYGEPSFLALVVFCLAVSVVVGHETLGRFSGRPKKRVLSAITSPGLFVWSGALFCAWIGSLSGTIYAIFLGSYALIPILINRKLNSSMSYQIAIAGTSSGVLIAVLLPYLIQRLGNLKSSLSFFQRFDYFSEFSLMSLTLGGVADEMPTTIGFHNGLALVLYSGGFAGVLFVFWTTLMLWRKPLSRSTRLLAVGALLAIYSQNGAVFSPNKLVLLAFVAWPCIYPEVTRRRASRLATRTANGAAMTAAGASER